MRCNESGLSPTVMRDLCVLGDKSKRKLFLRFQEVQIRTVSGEKNNH